MATENTNAGDHYVLNPAARETVTARPFFPTEELRLAWDFHRAQPGYRPTPLRNLKVYARELGIAELLVKDECSRLGLNAFKITGVAYAVHKLRASGALHAHAVLACATDGNHGRAVARIAHELNIRSKVYMHKGVAAARVEAIRSDGADVTIVDGNYDDTVRRLAMDAQRNRWLIVSDTSWPGYEQVPRDIMAGYTILMEEASSQWREPPDVVMVQVGVGGLAAAVIAWIAQKFNVKRPRVVCCEPAGAACVLESMRAGHPVELQGSLETIMAGLSCGTVSTLAWPILRSGLDACVTISDAECERAVRKLARPSGGDSAITAGESGACGVAALAAILHREDLRPVRDALRLDSKSRILAINTEGATDPASYQAILSETPSA